MQLSPFTLFLLIGTVVLVSGQGRISTIQLDGTQYFISNQNPYAPKLNFFLAYQYCRSIGLQLASFETREKADALTMYLKNAGYNQRDYWTSGNSLGTNMLLWMSTGLPFNATFDYMRTESEEKSSEDPSLNSARNLPTDMALGVSCMALSEPELHWQLHDCGKVKDFICEQTRCYYYNYGTIPVSATQGKPTHQATTTESHYHSTLAHLTTPHPGLLENSVAPEENVAENLQQAEDLVADDGEETVLGEAEEHKSEEETVDESSAIALSPTTSPHLPQPKRLEDLFPLERTRPIAWPKQ